MAAYIPLFTQMLQIQMQETAGHTHGPSYQPTYHPMPPQDNGCQRDYCRKYIFVKPIYDIQTLLICNTSSWDHFLVEIQKLQRNMDTINNKVDQLSKNVPELSSFIERLQALQAYVQSQAPYIPNSGARDPFGFDEYVVPSLAAEQSGSLDENLLGKEQRETHP
jgi:hypothetical protein